MGAKLPATWTASTLGAVALGILSGGTPSTKNEAFWRGSVPWITSKWINSRLYLDSGEKFISDDAVRQSATTVVPRNNLIFATRVGVGKVAVNRLDLAINQDLAGVVIDSNRYDIRFIAYQLRSERLQNMVSSHKRGATIQGITRDNLKELELNLPPLSEQQKIAGVLGVVQQAMEQQERLLKLTAELKKALLHQLFTAGLRGETQKQTEIGLVPQSWEVVRLENFTTLQRGKDLTKAEFRDGTIPVAGSNGVIGYHDTANVEGPGVTVGRSGSVGRICFYPSNFWAHNTSLYVKDFHGNDPRFAAYYLDHLRLDRFRSGASVPTLDRNQFKDMLIAVPKLDEQLQIARLLETVDKKGAVHQRKHAALTAVFRTLLHQLMTAQLRVHDLDLDLLECNLECGDMTPLSEGATRRSGQSAGVSAHSNRQSSGMSLHVAKHKLR